MPTVVRIAPRSSEQRIALDHPCGAVVHLVDGQWATPRGRVVTHCPGCREWLGSAFVRVVVQP